MEKKERFLIFAEEAEASDVTTTVSNVRKDLTEWQEKHATIVLTTVKVGSFYFSSMLFFFHAQSQFCIKFNSYILVLLLLFCLMTDFSS